MARAFFGVLRRAIRGIYSLGIDGKKLGRDYAKSAGDEGVTRREEKKPKRVCKASIDSEQRWEFDQGKKSWVEGM
jgi:hypothetical protein